MSNDVDVMRYLGGELLTDEQIQELANRQIRNFEELGDCYWLLELKETGEFIGLCGIQPKEPNAYDYGWRLAKEFWNHGYMTEAALAARDYAFGELGLSHLTSTALAPNTPSTNVMKKVGMRYVDSENTFRGEVVRHQLDNPNQ